MSCGRGNDGGHGVLFTFVTGRVHFIMVGSLVMPIMRSIGCSKAGCGAVFLMAFCHGIYFNMLLAAL